MSRRRSIHRKAQEQPTSRKALLLCLALAGAVVLVPVGGGFMDAAKAKLRDAALASGLIDLNDCVVTPNETIACAAGAVGTPVPAALHQMTVLQAEAAEDARRRDEAEANVRTLTAEIDRLNADAERNRVAARSEDILPAVVTTVTRTGATSDDAASLPIQVMPNPAVEPAGEFTAEPYEPVEE
jgi:hypothetical protein